jgi:predicted lactoylglutathione lyase
MIKQICLNIPVADLPKSKAFFRALGFSENPQVTGDTGAMIVISETISLVLTTHSRFREFTPKAVCDTTLSITHISRLCGVEFIGAESAKR